MIHYPNNHRRIYQRRPLKSGRFRRTSRRRKFRNHVYKEDGYVFASKVERGWYNVLKYSGKRFKVHPKLTYYPRMSYRSRIDGSIHYLRKRYYHPDFVQYDAKGNVIEIDDTKGIETGVALSYDHMKFDDFSRSTHIPVTVIRFKHGHFIKKVR